MNSKFLTPLIFGCALTMGALSFVACGDDSTSAPPMPSGSSSSTFVPTSFAQPTPQTAIRFEGLGINGTTSSRVKFKGSITIDLGDSNTVANVDAVRFTDIKFDIVSKTQTSGGKASTLVPLDLASTNVTTVNLSELGLYTNIDEDYTECGDFTLYITAKAFDGLIESVSIDTVGFVRPEEKCRPPESSSSEAKVPGAPLDSISIVVNTKTDKCLSFATGKASAETTGDVCFKTFGTNGNVQLSSTTGLKFAVYDNPNDGNRKTNYSKNWLPKEPTTDDFTYLETALKEPYPDFLNEVDVFFVAINTATYVPNTGSSTGFYAFVVSEQEAPDTNGDVKFTLLVYKGK